MIFPIFINFIIILITIFCAAVMDFKTRRVPIYTWIPAAIAIIPCLFIYYSQIPLDLAVFQLIMSILFSGISLGLVYLRFFGGADAIALILLSLGIPVNPFTGEFQFIWVYVIIVSCTLILLWSGLNYFKNVRNKKHGNFEQLAFSSLIPSEQLRSVKGWVYVDGEQKYVSDLSDSDLSLFSDGSDVWVVIAMPFICPILAALVITIMLG